MTPTSHELTRQSVNDVSSKGHSMTGTRTLEPELLHRMDAYWRAANYLSVGQIYLYDNPLLRRRSVDAAGLFGIHRGQVRSFVKDGVNPLRPSHIECIGPCVGENVTMTNVPSQGDPQLLSRWSDSRGAVGAGAV